jgi:GNAT superfamily N-acetyltransferase
MSTGVVVRTAAAADLPALAVLRWRWARPGEPVQPDVLRDFRALLGDWMARQGEASVCKIAVLGEELVGMAWLAVFDRVPNPGDEHRLSGDVQSVFVIPEHRGLGIGRQLVEAVCRAADDLGIRKLTVDSGDEAVPFYQHLGFSRSDRLLVREVPLPSR